jgi:hypothetical protein
LCFKHCASQYTVQKQVWLVAIPRTSCTRGPFYIIDRYSLLQKCDLTFIWVTQVIVW